MSGYKGILFLVAIGGSPLVPVLTSRNVDISTSTEFVDTTNKGSGGQRKGLAGAGVQQHTISFDGVFEDAVSEQTLKTNYYANTIDTYTVYNENGDMWVGGFQITNMSHAGTYNGEETYSFTLESADTVTYTPAA